MSNGCSLHKNLEPGCSVCGTEIKRPLPNAPEIGSQWFNNRRQKVYTVHGLVAACEGEDDWELLYRSDDMPEGHYRRRSVESWYGLNREGLPRFEEVKQNEPA